jgi:hypothetical protein
VGSNGLGRSPWENDFPQAYYHNVNLTTPIITPLMFQIYLQSAWSNLGRENINVYYSRFGGFNAGWNFDETDPNGDVTVYSQHFTYQQTEEMMYGSGDNENGWNATKENIDYTLNTMDFSNTIIAKAHNFRWGENATSGIFKDVGTGFAILSVASTIVDVAHNRKWETHNTIDIAVTGITFAVPVAGEIFGVLWFVGDIISEGVNNKSLSENLAEKFGGQ